MTIVDVDNNGRKVKTTQNVTVKRTHIELFERLALTPPTDLSNLKKSLLILTTPRSGSTLFSEALNSTNELGWCEEWFNYEYFAAYLIVNKIEVFNLKDYLKWVAERTIRNGTYCLKWHVGQVEDMKNDFGVDLANMHFDHVIWLYRRDIIGQSLSLARALTTNQFRSYEDSNGQDPAQVDECDITNALAITLNKYRYFNQHLAQYVHRSYAYEDVCDLNHFAYRSTLEAMGRPTVIPPGVTLKKQRDELTEEIYKAYRDYLIQILEVHDAYN